MRGLLLAAAMPHDASREEYWSSFASAAPLLAGLRAHDPFAGGGTILVEAARLGADATGMDVDPLAVQIVKHELGPPDLKALQQAAKRLLAHVHTKAGHLYSPSRKGWIPLHYFFLHEVECPACNEKDLLYRDLVLARDVGKHGGVIRQAALHAFCPRCLRVHELSDAGRKTLTCCNQTRPLYAGTFSAQSYKCPACGTASMHADLKTAACPRTLVAVEETRDSEYRRIRRPNERDHELLAEAARHLSRSERLLSLPNGRFKADRLDARPISLGIREPRQLFTDRQLAVFGRAFCWIENADVTTEVRRALTLGLSNALSTNNKLCGYARDYGRIAPLFSVRSYSLPALAVELNPFHPNAGRGTLRKILDRLERSCKANEVRRYIWSTGTQKTAPCTMRFEPHRAGERIKCVSAASRATDDERSVDICVFDPPYFNYIAYSELSEFHRAWLDSKRLGGTPLLPHADDPVASFGTSLGACLRAIKRRLRPGRPLAFTYHSATPAAWEAVGQALDESDLVVTALWPLRNDVHMGHHTASGNCEWDVVVVCRRAAECTTAPNTASIVQWRKDIRRLPLSEADLQGMKHAIAMADERFGKPN